MLKNRTNWFALVSAILFATGSAHAQNGPASGVYQIISGRLWVDGGFVQTSRDLPDDTQSFVELTIDSQNQLAQMKILGKDMRTVFRVPPVEPCCDEFTFSFSDGTISPDYIQFGAPFPFPFSYTVSNSADALQINGTVALLCKGGCADVPDRFRHTNVVAVLIPAATVRCSEVEVCWNAASNRVYQVQYRSSLTTNVWNNLGPPITGSGSTTCINDKVPTGEPQRFCRVVPLR